MELSQVAFQATVAHPRCRYSEFREEPFSVVRRRYRLNLPIAVFVTDLGINHMEFEGCISDAFTAYLVDGSEVKLGACHRVVGLRMAKIETQAIDDPDRFP